MPRALEMSGLPANVALLSFEGPDSYSMVGGLGTRATELSQAFAKAGVATTLLFVGDPALQAVERPLANLEYRRWSQWISAYHPGGVYDGEWNKVADFTPSVPPFVADAIVEPAASRGESVLVLAEDWQTASAVILLDRLLRARGLRKHAMLVWNANNTFGFHTIDWNALRAAAWITTVSRYMKFELQAHGVESLVIPNGIPDRLLAGASDRLVRIAAAKLRRRPLFVKIGRFDADKRWMQAIEAIAALGARYPNATLIVRGGREAYGTEVFERAAHLGVEVEDVVVESRDAGMLLEALAQARGRIVNVRSFVPEEALLALYCVADGVLANSGREPFGLVGLEVMAVGGVAVTGSTGEDYAAPFENAIVCDTADWRELYAYLDEMAGNPALARSIREAGKRAAERYTWPRVLEMLGRKLRSQG